MEIRLKAGTTKQSFVKNLEDTRQILRIFKGLFKEDKYHYWGQLLRAEVDSSIQLYSNQEFKVYKFQLYTGEFIEGKRSGSGQLKIFKQDGDTNLREIINSQPSYHYEGEFLLNKKEGMGKETNDDGEVYDGEFSNGKRNGKGNLTNKELTYQGEFENGQFNGEGSCNWKDGRAYMGEWSEGFKHGRGEFLWPDGRIYKGSQPSLLKINFFRSLCQRIETWQWLHHHNR